jgi:hypothetical protein
MFRLFVILLPALLFAAGNTSPVTVLPQEGAVPTGAALVTAPPSPGAPFKVDIGVVDTVGGTTFDWQANGPSLRSLMLSPDKGVHVGWMYSSSTSGTTFPDRNMRYNFFDDSVVAWNWIDPDFMQSGVNVFSDRSGFGNLSNEPATGAAVFSRHYGTSPLQFGVGRDVAAGAGIFEYCAGPMGYLWGAIDVDANNWIHSGLMDDPGRQNLWYTRCTTWCTWETPQQWDVPTFPTQGIAASKVSQKVAIGWVISNSLGQQAPAYYRTSDDGGSAWSSINTLDFPPAFGGDTVTSFHISSMFTFFDRARDNLHIVVAVNPIINDTNYVLPAEIWHFSPENIPQWSEIHRASTGNLLAPLGYNAIYACRPSIGEDRFGGLYVAWEQFDSSNYEPGPPTRARADIFYAQDNGDNGMTWQTGVKMTTPGTWTSRFPSAIDYFPDDTFRVSYLIDEHAGFFLYSEGPATYNPVVVHKVAVNASPGVGGGRGPQVTALALSASPNPFNGRTGLSYALPRPGRVVLEVFDLSGRSVARPVDGFKPAGRYSAALQAKGLAPGIYVARLSSGGSCVTRKLVLTD